MISEKPTLHSTLAAAAYEKCELVATLGGLQTLPENQYRLLRLLEVARVACSMGRGGVKAVDHDELREMLNSISTANELFALQEDPPEDCFTQNLVFHGGNYVVYTGLDEAGPLILQNLLRSIYVRQDTYSPAFLSEVKGHARTVLELSDAIALRCGHERFMSFLELPPEGIYVPGIALASEAAQAVTFSMLEIQQLVRCGPIITKYLQPFLLNQNTLDIQACGPENNPLRTRPFVAFGDTVVVAAPCEMVPALLHFIFSCAKRHRVLDLVTYGYRKALEACVQLFMRPLCLELTSQLPPAGNKLPFDEFLFRIDTDKAAYVQLVTDDLTGFSEAHPDTPWKAEAIEQEMSQRCQMVAESLTGGASARFSQLLIVTVLGSLGRPSMWGRGRPPRNTLQVLLSVEDLHVLTQLGQSDPLNLWKYAKARERLLNTAPGGVMSFSFLDSYAIFRNNNQSFYTGDEGKPFLVMHAPGSGASLRIKAARLSDIHGARYDYPPQWISVRRYESDEAIPIYFREEGIAVPLLERLVEGYTQPIWIRPPHNLDVSSQVAWRGYRLMADALSYWVWQLTRSVKPLLQPLGPDPLMIIFRLQDPDAWSEMTPPPTQDANQPIDFQLGLNGRTMSMVVPTSILANFSAEYNYGDRIVVSEILKLFDNLLAASGLKSPLSSEARTEILDLHAPVGQKKKLLVISTRPKAALNPSHLPHFRNLQEYDIQELLDGLVEALGLDAFASGEITDPKERTEICNKIVELYVDNLQRDISEFDWKDLLTYLVGQHEAYWHQHATDVITVPTNRACFGEISSRLDDMATEWSRFQATGTAIRTVIELVAAEPPHGRRKLSTEAMDRILAIANHIVNWATISDFIHHEVIDYRLNLLASGRIRIEGDMHAEGWLPFLQAKASENIQTAIQRFASHFEHEHSSATDSTPAMKADAVFEEEFGLTFTHMCEFLVSLTFLGFEQGTAACALQLSELRNRLKGELNWDEFLINQALDGFSLAKRMTWLEAPPGFDAGADIWPWRHNRRLCYVRRPVIVGPEPANDPLVYWGPRHCDEVIRHLIDVVYTGRYEPKSTSKGMRSLVNGIRDQRGKEFAGEVRDWLRDHTRWRVEPEEVPIKPGKPLNAARNLGDIDALCFDTETRRLFSIECKNLNFARTPRAIANESERLIHQWMPKHKERHDWLENNIELVAKVFQFDADGFRVVSLVITSQEVPSAYLRTVPIPVISLPALELEGPTLLSQLACRDNPR